MGKTWLVAWLGKTDHECAEGLHRNDIGPIATALLGAQKYDRVYLLTNYDFDRSKRYCRWLEKRTGWRHTGQCSVAAQEQRWTCP